MPFKTLLSYNPIKTLRRKKKNFYIQESHLRDIFFLALQCRLDCDPGYVSQRAPIITCVDGRYEPFRPSTFICQPAAVLVITEKGDVEIFSNKPECQSNVTENFANFTGFGRTLSLLDDQILLVGGDLNATKHTYVNIQHPRQGLHAMKYTIEKFPLGGSPHAHTSFGSGNRLLVIGGAHRTRAKFEDFTWNSLDLRKPDGTKFTTFVSSPCLVKISRDEYLILGGEQKNRNGTFAIDSVFKVNITSEVIERKPPMLTKRMKHSCEKLSENSVLVSGGKALLSGDLLHDEIYFWEDGMSTAIEAKESLMRFQHQLVRIGETIFALGGLTEQNKGSTTVEKFETGCVKKMDDYKDCRWIKHEQNLISKDVANLVVTSFPQSAIDCGIECQCGIEKSRERIIGGVESAQYYPWIAAMIMDKNRDASYVESHCSAMLVCST